jgi:hypothetical protein
MPSPNRVLVLAPGYGVAPVTTSESVTYNVNTEEITQNNTEDHNKDQYGNPNQSIYQKDLYDYKAEWQLASSSTLPPTFGTTFTRTVENEASAITFVVLKATVAKTTETKIRTASIEAKQANGGAGNVSTSNS